MGWWGEQLGWWVGGWGGEGKQGGCADLPGEREKFGTAAVRATALELVCVTVAVCETFFQDMRFWGES